MRKYSFKFILGFFILSFLFSLTLRAGVEPEYRFGIISRIVSAVLAGEHFRAQPDADKLSDELFVEYLSTLDPNKLYFTAADVEEFKKGIKGNLYTNLTRGDVSFAFIVYNSLLDKVETRWSASEEQVKNGLDFTEDEEYMLNRKDAEWAASDEELNVIWKKKLKNDILTFKLMEIMSATDTSADSDDKNARSKYHSSLTPEERTLRRLKTYKNYLKENDPIQVLEIYLTALSRLYDPHSSYMSPKSEEDFTIQMQLSFVGIGALLSNEDGVVKVEKIISGGPAEKSGVLKSGDRIIAVGEEGAVPVDVVDVPLNKVVDKIRGAKGSNVFLTILPAEEGVIAVPKVISIKRDVVELKDSEASSEIVKIEDLNGVKRKIGIVGLPSFYMDFQGAYNGEKNYKSSTKDVKAILDKFKSEKVDGVIVDIRSNGGGSLKEAIELTGLFIGKKPVVQTKDSRNNIRVESVENGNEYYDGPLIVLTNKLSASASEIFAGAIQDYGRGIIIGDKSTHGKGTVQTVIDLSSLLSRFNMDLNAGAIKITNAKFYRVSGGSTQNRGIIPDIQYNSFLDHMDIGESYLKYALPWDFVRPVEYQRFDEKFSSELPVFKSRSEARQADSLSFKKLDGAIGLYSGIAKRNSVPLNEEKRIQLYTEEKKIIEEQKTFADTLFNDKLEKDNKEIKEKDIFLNETLNIFIDYLSFLDGYKFSKE